MTHSPLSTLRSPSWKSPARTHCARRSLLQWCLLKLKDLTLVEIRAKGLLQACAPYAHPMGSFWFLKLTTLSDMVSAGILDLQYQPCELSFSMVAGPFTPKDLLSEARSLNWKKRKADLEVEILHLKDLYEGKCAELSKIKELVKE